MCLGKAGGEDQRPRGVCSRLPRVARKQVMERCPCPQRTEGQERHSPRGAWLGAWDREAGRPRRQGPLLLRAETRPDSIFLRLVNRDHFGRFAPHLVPA